MFDKLTEALLSIGVPVSRFFATKESDSYIVWGEDGQSKAFYANNKMALQTLTGGVHFFTKIEDDETFHKIQRALNESVGTWALEFVRCEGALQYIHYKWNFEVENGTF